MKFDVGPGQQRGESTGYGQLEYAYHLMAVDAGLRMSECRLVEVDGLTHFLTRRFDRPGPTARLHVQSLAAIAHLPPEHPGAHSYEQFQQTCLRLGLDVSDRTQAFRQIVFNVAAAAAAIISDVEDATVRWRGHAVATGVTVGNVDVEA